MPRRERDKGRKGEREVTLLLERAGFTVRALEGTGDHLALTDGLVFHVESKRQETARPWAWLAQAEAEAPAGAVPLVAFRRSHGRWYALLPLEDFARIIGGRGE